MGAWERSRKQVTEGARALFALCSMPRCSRSLCSYLPLLAICHLAHNHACEDAHLTGCTRRGLRTQHNRYTYTRALYAHTEAPCTELNKNTQEYERQRANVLKIQDGTPTTKEAQPLRV